MGDFNCRFGGEESSIVTGNNQFTFSRTTHDMDSKAKDARRGSYLVTSMNASQMVVMNGIDSGGELPFPATAPQSST